MVGETTLEELRRRYSRCLERDWFAGPSGPSAARVYSVRGFIHAMTMGRLVLAQAGIGGPDAFPDLTDLNIKFGDLMTFSLRQPTGDLISIRQLVFEQFCKLPIEDLAWAVATESQHDDQCARMWAEMKASDWKGWVTALQQEDTAHAVAMRLCDDLLAACKDRSLYSFFVREPNREGFRDWGEGASPGIGRPLKTHRIDVAGGIVEVKVNRYEECDMYVVAYEWTAKLLASEGKAPDAVACGMVYVLERSDGLPIGGPSALLEAADQVADADILQVNAFLEQHADAGDIMDESDLCFLWIWERRGDAQPGAGAQCLRAALESLTKRFKRVRTLIIDTRPSQFVSWDDPADPPMVQVAKQAAIERLVGYVQEIALPRVEVRHIFNRHGENPEEALAVLGRNALNQRGMDDEGLEEDEPDWAEFEDELMTLCHQAGLPELAERIGAGDAESYEIERVLKSLLLHNRIPYMPLPALEAEEMDELLSVTVLPQEAMQDDNVSRFVECLPDDVHVIGAYFSDCAAGDGPGWVIHVQTETLCGGIDEFFTMTHVPRTVDASWILSR